MLPVSTTRGNVHILAPAALTEEGIAFMKCKALFGLRLLLGLLLFAIGSGQTGGFDVVAKQIETIGPRQWLNLMAGSLASTAVIAPVSQRIAAILAAAPATPEFSEQETRL
jgi:hypothetical protein